MSACLLYVGTSDGILVLEFQDEALEPVGRGLQGNAVRGIAIHPHDPEIAYVACGLRGWGLHRTRDAGRNFEMLGFQDRWVWDVAFHPGDPATLFVGTEPPMLHVTRDEGGTFQAFDGIEELPSRSRWMFFHEPFRAGHVHGIAVHLQQPDRIYAGVEHGAFIYSHDAGRTWHEALVGFDLHRVAVDPVNADRVFAGAGEGLYVSADAGRTWNSIPALEGKYVHAIAFDPRSSQTIYVYVAAEGAPLHKSIDGGENWRQIGAGLPAARPADTICLHPQDPGVVFYGGDIGEKISRIFVSQDAGETWQPLPGEFPKIWRMRAAPRSRGGT